MIKTSAPVWASITAVFTAVVVLPSEGWLEVTRIVFGACPAVESNSDVRRCRYASAIGERFSRSVNNTSPFGFPFAVILAVLEARERPRFGLAMAIWGILTCSPRPPLNLFLARSGVTVRSVPPSLATSNRGAGGVEIPLKRSHQV